MAEKDQVEMERTEMDAAVGVGLATSMVVNSAPGFAIANLMISSVQAQSRALEAAVAGLNNSYPVGLATTAESVSRIFNTPDDQQKMLAALIAANKT